MHILYFHQHFNTPLGTAGTRSYEMAKRLIARGHEVTMVCGSSVHANTGLTGKPRFGIRTGYVDGIRVVEICLAYSAHDSFVSRSLTFLRYAMRAVVIAWKTRYDLLFATSTPLTAGIPGIVMRLLKPRRPFVFEVRDLWPELPREMGIITNPVVLWAMGILEWLSYNAAVGCIGLSPGMAEGIRRRLAKKAPVAMIPNGSDLEHFEPPVERKPRRSGLRVIFAGAHGIANGLDAVLDAAAVLKRRGRDDIELVFVGDGNRKPQLVARARDEQLSNCKFLDPIPRLKMPEAMHRMDAALMILDNVPAFYYGTSPNKFFDYLAAGLPVINNYPGWVADLIGQSGCGIALPPDNPEAFADALCLLADDPDSRAAMGRRARELAEQQFGRDALGQQFVEFLERFARNKTAVVSPARASVPRPHTPSAKHRDADCASIATACRHSENGETSNRAQRSA